MKFLIGSFLLLLVAVICCVKSEHLEFNQIPKDEHEKCVKSSELLLSQENKNVTLNYIIDWKPRQTVNLSIRKLDENNQKTGAVLYKLLNIPAGNLLSFTFKSNDGKFSVCFEKNVESGAEASIQRFYLQIKNETGQ